jgi:hypothetical protein
VLIAPINLADPASARPSDDQTDLVNPSAVDLHAYSYRSPGWRFSLLETGTALDLFQVFAASRMGLGVGRDLMTGNGVGKPLGLIPSLQVLGNCQAGVCQGSSETTGGPQTGANSIGYSDILLLANSLDNAVLAAPKCAFLCNVSTRSSKGRNACGREATDCPAPAWPPTFTQGNRRDNRRAEINVARPSEETNFPCL